MSVQNSGPHRGIASINPATEEVVKRFAPLTEGELEHRLSLAEKTFHEFRRSSFSDRAVLMNRATDLLDQDKSSLARIMTLEMGKPILASVQEVEKCAKACRYYAEHAPGFLADETRSRNKETKRYVRYEALGAVLAVMPWNFPFWQVFRFAAPALMAGNVGLLKHASNVPQCALAIEDVFRRAGFPEGVFQALLIGPDGVDRVIEDRRIRAVTLTGSVGAGSKVAATAGRVIKKTVLELGGSDPFIVMPSADLEKTVATAVQARTINNGQSCIAAKRFIVHKSVAREFQARFVEKMASLKVGDPFDEHTDIGPLATGQVAADLQAQVERTVEMGAKVLLGGHRMKGPGFFFQPTVLAEIPVGSPAHKDELFGPVASVFPADSANDAVRIANDTPFGLGASGWTNDPIEKETFISEIEAGMVFINGMVASDPVVPFGGVKQSGYGRELSQQGIREFMNIKTVVVSAS